MPPQYSLRLKDAWLNQTSHIEHSRHTAAAICTGTGDHSVMPSNIHSCYPRLHNTKKRSQHHRPTPHDTKSITEHRNVALSRSISCDNGPAAAAARRTNVIQAFATQSRLACTATLPGPPLLPTAVLASTNTRNTLRLDILPNSALHNACHMEFGQWVQPRTQVIAR